MAGPDGSPNPIGRRIAAGVGRRRSPPPGRCAAIYALPARYEPFRLEVLEAAAPGCALVLGDIASLRELWDGAALFVAPDDDRALRARAERSRRRRRPPWGARPSRPCTRPPTFGSLAMARRYEVLYRAISVNRSTRAPAFARCEARDGGASMKVVLFCHSLLSDWNHGNAHFLRGLTLRAPRSGTRRRRVRAGEAWSVVNLVADHGLEALELTRKAFPSLAPVRYQADSLDLDEALDGCDLALVHEWNEPGIVRRIGRHRARSGRYAALFHDTHHRAVTAPEDIERLDLTATTASSPSAKRCANVT